MMIEISISSFSLLTMNTPGSLPTKTKFLLVLSLKRVQLCDLVFLDLHIEYSSISNSPGMEKIPLHGLDWLIIHRVEMHKTTFCMLRILKRRTQTQSRTQVLLFTLGTTWAAKFRYLLNVEMVGLMSAILQKDHRLGIKQQIPLLEVQQQFMVILKSPKMNGQFNTTKRRLINSYSCQKTIQSGQLLINKRFLNG